MDCKQPVRDGPRCKKCAARRRWDRTLVEFPLRPCKTCDELITGANRRKAKYCSHACRVADRSSYPGRSTNQTTKTCPGCESEFSIAKAVAHRYIYCSRACRAEAKGRTTECKRCGSPFRHPATENRSYCSETCRRPPAIKVCENCGIEFRTQPSVANAGRRYCSRRCYVTSSAETSIERIVREALESGGYDFDVQVPIGPWVVDFALGHLVIEADGDYWHSLRPEADARKTANLEDRGFTVWRIAESEIVAPDFRGSLLGRLREHGYDRAPAPLASEAADIAA